MPPTIALIASAITLLQSTVGALVVVTGASGFVGCEICHQLSAQGFDDVAAVVRDSSRAAHLSCIDGVRIVKCDLADSADSRFEQLLDASDAPTCVINSAAVFKRGCTDAETELVGPTLTMTHRVIRACTSRTWVKRLVHTSSMAAVRDPSQSPRNGAAFYTAEDWNTVSQRDGAWPAPYQFSKAESERELWKYAQAAGSGPLELITLCPSMIFGPVRSYSASQGAVSVTDMEKWLDGRSAVQSRLIVDVRDAAAAHVAALNVEVPEGRLGRYIVSPESRVAAADLMEAIKQDPELAAHFPLHLMTADTAFSPTIPIGCKEVDPSSTIEDLGVQFRSPIETVLDMARSLAEAAKENGA